MSNYKQYADSMLLPEEKLLHEAKVSNSIMIAYIVLAVLSIPTIWFPPIFIWRACVAHFVNLAITHKRIITKYGVINRKSIELPLDKIESLQLQRTWLGSIFGYGTIIITGTGGTKSKTPYIEKPVETRARLMQIIEWTKEQKQQKKA